MGKKRNINQLIKVFQIVGFGFILITLALIAIPTAPYVWYRLNPEAVSIDEEKLGKEIVEKKEDIKQTEQTPVSNLPPFDPNLPEGYFVLIPSVGIKSPITASKEYKKALTKGTWIVSDFGTPELDSLPIILAAHRFGYNSWTIEKRNLISFYNLPETKSGDKVIIYWNQREYEYEIYDGNIGTYITDYSADLILYTCKYYNSPERIFRYAKRVEK